MSTNQIVQAFDKQNEFEYPDEYSCQTSIIVWSRFADILRSAINFRDSSIKQLVRRSKKKKQEGVVMKRFVNQVAVITGGSNGIGKKLDIIFYPIIVT